MSMPKVEVRKKIPLLVGLSIERTGEDTLPGHYDAKQDVWVIEDNNKLKPIIKIASDILELSTKTATMREQDDPGNMLALETSTKTCAQIERDDFVGSPMIGLLQLFTKTKVQNERDDS